MRKEALALLLGYWDAQKEVIDGLVEGIRTGDTISTEKTVHLGYLLHNLYSALEDLFQEIARTFENRLEQPSQFHKELLKRMSIEVPQIRPKVLSKESYLFLNELHAFRHIFRHSYSYTLSPNKVMQLKDDLLSVWHKVEADLDAFRTFLQDNLEEAT